MWQLHVKQKTGFTVTDINQPIIINDHRGILFYSTLPLLDVGKKVFCFNLPKGTYMVVNGEFEAKMFPVKYSLIKLPWPQRYLPKPDDFSVSFGPNPNKCTIFWEQKKILFDTSFREKPLNEIFFILFHEYGHHLYHDEKYADIFAVNEMLRYGFNPYQTGTGQLDSLSDRQRMRKEFVINKISNYVR